MIRGARQVGKSTLVYQLAEAGDLSLLTINFERNPEYQDAFTSNIPSEIKTFLQLLTGQQIISGETLLFLDEIQAAPEALKALRYFYEEEPDLHVVAAGSLLEFTLDETNFSMPVGRIEYFHLGPMQFDDFLKALDQATLADNLAKVSFVDGEQSAITKVVHDRYLQFLKIYWVIGGLPESVAVYAKTKELADVHKIQQGIVQTYRDDFNKYSHGKMNSLVQLVYDQLPVMVGRKFKYAHVSREYKSRELEKALQQLCLAGIATKVLCTSANGLPMGAEVKQKFFKTVYLDIGLMCASLNLNLLGLSQGDITLINDGALAEQFIGQILKFSGKYYEAPQLYYWAREAKSSSAEVDYLLAVDQQIIPVEVKAGATGSLKSMHQFLAEKHADFALRFNADLPSFLRDYKKLTGGKEITYKLLSLPLYLVGEAQRLIRELL